MELAFGIGRDVRIQGAQHVLHFLGVKHQADGFRFAQHPAQRDFREATFSLVVTAADIGVNAREPHLLQILRGRRGFVHQVLAEKRAALVDRYGMTQIADAGQGRCEGQMAAVGMNGIENPADRADGVPQSEEVRDAGIGSAESVSETRGNFEFAGIVAFVKAESVWYQRFVARREQAAHPNQSAERAGGVGTATETENEDLVDGIELRHQERVDVSDVVGKSVAERQTPDFCPPLADHAESISGAHGADAGVVVGDLLVLGGEGPVELYDVGICGSVFVAGAVAADDYVA